MLSTQKALTIQSTFQHHALDACCMPGSLRAGSTELTFEWRRESNNEWRGGGQRGVDQCFTGEVRPELTRRRILVARSRRKAGTEVREHVSRTHVCPFSKYKNMA